MAKGSNVESFRKVWLSPKMISLIQPFHKNVSAELTINKETLEGAI